jgi:hypothetical protein
MEPEGFNIEIYGYHSGDPEEYYLLRYDARKLTRLHGVKFKTILLVYHRVQKIPLPFRRMSQMNPLIKLPVYFLIVLNFCWM